MSRRGRYSWNAGLADDNSFLLNMLERVREAVGDKERRSYPDLLAYLKEIARDAARYQQVRRGQHWSVTDGIGNTLRAEALDAAVDAAMPAPPRMGEPS